MIFLLKQIFHYLPLDPLYDVQIVLRFQPVLWFRFHLEILLFLPLVEDDGTTWDQLSSSPMGFNDQIYQPTTQEGAAVLSLVINSKCNLASWALKGQPQI